MRIFDTINEIKKHFQAKDFNNVLMELSKLDQKDLALFVLNVDNLDDELKECLQAPELKDFWAKKYHNLWVKTLPSFKFHDVPGRTHMELYCGYVLYLQALYVKQDPSSCEYINLAIKAFNSFHAFEHQASNLIEKAATSLQEAAETKESDELSKNVVRPLLEFHGTFRDQIATLKTPGFLSLANITIFLARFFQLQDSPVLSKLFFETTWQHLHMAALLEKYSAAEINNAYFGAGLAPSNFLGLDSIASLKSVCLKEWMEDQSVDTALLQRIERSAFAKFKEDYPELATLELASPKLASSGLHFMPPPAPSPIHKRNPSVMAQAFMLFSPSYKALMASKSFTFEDIQQNILLQVEGNRH